jgi:predicted nucleic acid-binding protein
MSGDKYLADTNTFIYLLNKHPSLSPLLESDWSYSFVTEIELLGKFRIFSEELKQVKSLLQSCSKISYSDDISRQAISLRQQHKIKIPDAIIAATAIVKKMPLLTFDKGFRTVKSIDLVLLDY